MDSHQKVLFSAINLMLILFAAWISYAPAQENNIVRLSGSKYMYFGVTDLAKLYTDRNPDFNVVVTHTDSHAALPALLQKASDAIMVLGKLDDDAKNEAAEAGIQLYEHVIGWGAVVLVTNPENPVHELTVEQVRKIFLGEIQNWRDVGGSDEPIATMSRDEAVSGTENFFREFVLEGSPMAQKTIRVLDHNIVNAVWKRKGSIADARYTEAIRGRIKGMVKIMAIREDANSPAIVPSVENVKNRSYPLGAPLVLYYDARSGSQTFKDFVGFCARRGLGDQVAEAKR